MRTGWACVATCLGGAASALCYGGRFADAVPVATEGLAVARAIGMPTAITINLVALAQALSRQEPERARVLLDEAAHQDLDYETTAELTQMTLAAAMLSDWPLTARFATRSIPHAPLDQPPAVSPRHLHRLRPRPGRHRPRSRRHHPRRRPHAHRDPRLRPPRPPAADAPGAPTHDGPADRPGLIVETRRETTRLLVEALGDERLRALRDHGATMDTDTAVAYTLSRLDAFLTNTDD